MLQSTLNLRNSFKTFSFDINLPSNIFDFSFSCVVIFISLCHDDIIVTSCHEGKILLLKENLVVGSKAGKTFFLHEFNQYLAISKHYRGPNLMIERNNSM